jgi:phosphoadenosine phosphosulfate reductase
MGLSQLDFYGHNKVEVAIMRIRQFAEVIPYYGAFSGGKDSQTVYHLCRDAGIFVEWHFHQTTVDPIEVLRFINENYPNVVWDRPNRTMYQLIEQEGFPIRQHKSCCDELKERGGEGRLVVTGIRAEESGTRKHRSMLEFCYKSVGKRFLHPIIDWNEDEVWEYLNSKNLPHCSLYDEGFKRIGCVLCPNHGAEEVQFELKRFPQIARAYRMAFHARWAKGLPSNKRWKSADDMFEWWLSRKGEPQKTAECSMFA